MTHKTRSPSLQHLPCLSKSSFSPYFFPSTCLFPNCSPQTEVTSSPQQQCAAIAIQLPMHGTWDFNLQYTTLHYSAHYMQRAIPILERTPCRKFLHRCRNFKLYSHVVTASHSFLRDNIIVLSLLTGGSKDSGFLVVMKSSQKLLINAVITATVYRYIRWHVSKGEKERDVAPTRGKFPCPAFGPHGARLSAWVCLDFFLDLFSSFLFFLCPFSLGFSIQTRYLSSIVSLDTFAHAHSPRSAGSKCQKKFGTIYHFDINLIWSTCVHRGHLLSRVRGFQTNTEWESRAHCKKCPTLLKPAASVVLFI